MYQRALTCINPVIWLQKKFELGDPRPGVFSDQMSSEGLEPGLSSFVKVMQ